VVWTFPEAGLVIVTIDGAVRAKAPEPFSIVMVNYMRLDVVIKAFFVF